jgi:hypothetical protein
LSRHGKKIAKQIEEMCMIAKKEFELWTYSLTSS